MVDWQIAKWDDERQRWDEVCTVDASSPKTAAETFRDHHHNDEHAQYGARGPGDGAWHRFNINLDCTVSFIA